MKPSPLVFAVIVIGAACGNSDSGPPAEPPADGGDDSATSTLGSPCSTPGALGCNGHAQKLQLLCDGSKWVSNGVCPGQQVCDTRPGTTAGSCQDPLGVCVGKTPGASFCDGAVRQTCGPDLLTLISHPCVDAEHCATGVGPDCAKVCTAGAYRCNIDTLELCTASGGGYDPVKICPPGGCDSIRKTCVECKSGDKGCEGNTPHACDSAGHWKLLDPCVAPTPKCLDGLCVAG